MEYYGNNDWRDYHLAHFGVKGMKWGKHLKAASDWWSKNITGDYYKKKAFASAAQRNEYAAKASDSYGKLWEARRNVRGVKGLTKLAKAKKEDAKTYSKYKVHQANTDRYYKLDKANKTIGQRIKETSGNIAKSVVNGYRTKVTGDSHYDGTHPSAVAIRRAKNDINDAKQRREVEKRRNKYIVGKKPIDKVKAVRDMHYLRRHDGIVRSAIRGVNDGLQGAQVIANAKRKADRALIPRTKNAINNVRKSAGKAISSGAKKLSKAASGALNRLVKGASKAKNKIFKKKQSSYSKLVQKANNDFIRSTDYYFKAKDAAKKGKLSKTKHYRLKSNLTRDSMWKSRMKIKKKHW